MRVQPMKFSLTSLMLAVSLLGSPAHAEVRRIVHPDGRVEYTNIQSNSPAAVSSTYYKYRNTNGVLSFSDQKPLNVKYEVMRFDCYACRPGSRVNWETTPLFTDRYQQEIERIAATHSVDPALVRAVIHAESAFNPQARSRVGAQGLMQLMPATAEELGVVSPFNPEQNIDGGVRYLAMLLQRYEGDITLATAAYNAGPGAVQRYNGIPPFAETQAYVRRIEILHRRYRQAG
jgi:Soluble lytic murein transglycosylase and related regulatory proteins (some contain LysM/invasin domains)